MSESKQIPESQFILAQQIIEAKRTQWQTDGYNQAEIAELTQLLERLGQIRDEVNDLDQDPEINTDPDKKRQVLEKLKEFEEERQGISLRREQIRQTLYQRKEQEEKERIEREKQAELERKRKERAEKRAKGELDPKREELEDNLERVRQELEADLNQRAEQFKQNPDFQISAPEIPEDLTQEHFEALTSIFGQNNLELAVLPKPEELRNLDRTYVQMMYPETQTDEDTKRNLKSKRPSYFKNKVEISGFDFQGENWQEAFLRNMREELTELNNPLILVESIQKPEYINGSQQYGSKEGTNASQDHLLSTIQEVFGSETANRFNHNIDEIEEKLLPKIKEKIQKIFQDQGLPIPDFRVILCPAALFNLQTTFKHPENSQTSTWEWTSTRLKDKNNQDTSCGLRVGRSALGGASDVDDAQRGVHRAHRGFRLAVVFHSPKA